MALGQYLGAGSGITKGLFHLNGNANDSSGNSNNGTATNVTWVGGRLGSGAGSFTKATPSTIVGTSSIVLTAAFTINIWFKTSSTSTDLAMFGSYENVGGTSYMLHINVSTNNGAVRGFARQGANMAQTEYGSGYNDGNWHLFTYQSSGTTQNTYVDGKLLGTTTVSLTGTYDTTHTFGIGCIRYNASNANYFDGIIDEVIVDFFEWTPSQIKKYYTYSKGRFANL